MGGEGGVEEVGLMGDEEGRDGFGCELLCKVGVYFSLGVVGGCWVVFMVVGYLFRVCFFFLLILVGVFGGYL